MLRLLILDPGFDITLTSLVSRLHEMSRSVGMNLVFYLQFEVKVCIVQAAFKLEVDGRFLSHSSAGGMGKKFASVKCAVKSF